NPVVFDHTISWPLAFQFDGTGPTIDVGNRPGLNTPTFTVSAFVKFNALSAGDMSIMDKMSVTAVPNEDGWRLLKQDDGFFWFCLGGGSVNGCTEAAATTVISTTAPVAGVWYNVVGVLSKLEIAIYVNGVKEGSKPLSNFTDSHSATVRIGSSPE